MAPPPSGDVAGACVCVCGRAGPRLSQHRRERRPLLPHAGHEEAAGRRRGEVRLHHGARVLVVAQDPALPRAGATLRRVAATRRVRGCVVVGWNGLRGGGWRRVRPLAPGTSRWPRGPSCSSPRTPLPRTTAGHAVGQAARQGKVRGSVSGSGAPLACTKASCASAYRRAPLRPGLPSCDSDSAPPASASSSSSSERRRRHGGSPAAK